MPNAVTVPSPRMAVTTECQAKLIFGVVLGAQGMVREAREWWWSAVRGPVPRVTVDPCRAELGRLPEDDPGRWLLSCTVLTTTTQDALGMSTTGRP